MRRGLLQERRLGSCGGIVCWCRETRRLVFTGGWFRDRSRALTTGNTEGHRGNTERRRRVVIITTAWLTFLRLTNNWRISKRARRRLLRNPNFALSLNARSLLASLCG